MTCRTVRRLLSRYLTHDLAAAEQQQLDRHLDACPHCSRLVAEQRAALTALTLLPVSSPAP